MKSILFESSVGALDLLLGTNVFVMADLYTYTLVSGAVLRFTNADIDIIYSGNTWTSRSVMHDTQSTRTTGHWKVGLGVDSWQAVVTPRTIDPVTGTLNPDQIDGQAFLAAVRSGSLDGATVRVDRAYSTTWPTTAAQWGNFSITGIVTIFAGRVAAIDIDRLSVTVTLNDMRELLTSLVPRNTWQAPCRHILYDAGCTLSAGTFKVTTACTAGSTKGILLSAAVPGGSGTFQQGRIVMTSGANQGKQRMVRTWVSGTFTLIAPLPFTVNTGDTFDAYPGCDKTFSGGCTAFSNTANFGGMPFIPAPETAV